MSLVNLYLATFIICSFVLVILNSYSSLFRVEFWEPKTPSSLKHLVDSLSEYFSFKALHVAYSFFRVCYLAVVCVANHFGFCVLHVAGFGSVIFLEVFSKQ